MAYLAIWHSYSSLVDQEFKGRIYKLMLKTKSSSVLQHEKESQVFYFAELLFLLVGTFQIVP